MSVDLSDRKAISIELLRCAGKTPEEREKAARELVKAMNADERRALSDRIDGVIEWVADYETEESRINSMEGF